MEPLEPLESAVLPGLRVALLVVVAAAAATLNPRWMWTLRRLNPLPTPPPLVRRTSLVLASIDTDFRSLPPTGGKAALDVQGLVLAAIHAAERGIADPMEPSELKLVLDTQVLFTQSNAKSKP